MTDPNEDLLNFEIRVSMQGYLTHADVREEVRFLADSMSTRKAFADKVGISSAYLCDIIQGRREPGPKVLQFLRLEKVIVYHDKEMSQ